MTVIESPPASADSDSLAATAAHRDAAHHNEDSAVGEPSGNENRMIRPVVTTDHAVIGRLFIVVSLAFALGAALLGVWLGLERRVDDVSVDFFSGLNSWFQMWTLYRAGILLLVLMPLLVGLAMAVVPSRVGADALAFPRAALASFWAWLIGAVIMLASVLGGGGWGALDGVTPAESDAIALTLLGTGMMIAALLLGAIVVATTVISLRKPGMTLLDTPPFAWSMLVTAVVWLFTLPVMVVNLVLIYVDLRGRPPIAFGHPESSDIWFQIDWITEQPAVYMMAVPVLGVAAEMVETTIGTRSSRPAVIATAIGAFGLLSIGGWSQDFFIVGAEHREGLVYVAFGLAAMLPGLAVLGVVAESLAQGGFKVLARLGATRLLGAVAGLLLLGGAVLAGALRVIKPFELLERSTSSGVFNAVAVASLISVVAALWHWSPRIFGGAAPESAGRAAIGLMLGGGVLLAGGDVISGFLGASDFPMRGLSIATDAAALVRMGVTSDTVTALSTVSLAGSIIVAVGLLGGVLGLALKRLARDKNAAGSNEETMESMGLRP